MNKKSLKIIVGILSIILLVGFIGTTVFAGELTPQDVEPATPEDTSGLTKIVNNIAGFLRNISIVGGVIILMIIGLKFMLGSTEEKAEYKKSLLPLVIGVLVVMSATSLMSFLIEMFTIS